ncbi:zinc finger CCCH domain-containing protein 20-like [Mangifera indica]|uniref:zinc finger CCCH domain-containing protein 20-like n=1 Tax=Mangifera indica TaxID=29780 RepID=UPI001CFA0C9D|nr:zinc finger CCCH domain-containing protein 20-like [Mangifera indica]
MMVGERHRLNPTVHVPPWPPLQDPTSDVICLHSNASSFSDVNCPYYLQEALAALQPFLPTKDPDLDSDTDILGLDADSPVDANSCNHFRMFEFKVRKCARGRSHDWTECPYAHPGEKARRRDPRKYHYSGAACPEFRRGSCKKGDSCEFAHGVFECWLHPARYRTQPCKDGLGCRRRVCFFAHTPEQLRILPQMSPGSIDTSSCAQTLSFLSSPESISPPMSPSLSRSVGSSSMSELVPSLKNLQLGKVKSLPSSWNIHMGGSPRYGSPRGSMIRPDCFSLPSTPTRPGRCYWDPSENLCEDEPVLERVESGRDLRARMFQKLCEENSLERVDPYPYNGAPDVDWVSDLVNGAN